MLLFLNRADTSTSILNNSTVMCKYQAGNAVFSLLRVHSVQIATNLAIFFPYPVSRLTHF